MKFIYTFFDNIATLMKKCAYFTTKNINKEAHKFLYKLIPFRNKHNYQLNLQNCALLVIDMQKLFFNQTHY